VRRERDACGERLVVLGVLRVSAALAADRLRRSAESVDLPVEIRASLAPGVPRLDLELCVENRARDHRLELLFPTGEPAAQAVFDGHCEWVVRPTALPPAAETAGWKEAPRPEQPMRAFVEAGALLVAARGLREASVSPEGEIALTLLRCFGWLSWDDLRTRRGGAGPHVPTPGGQSPGPHRFALSIVPVAGDPARARREADAFQALPRGEGTRIGPGSLPPRASLLAVEPPSFRLTAVHLADDGAGLVARGVLQDGAPREVRLRPLRGPLAARRVRLDETPLEALRVEPDGSVRLLLRPNEIASVRFDFEV
jgi:alpha-mannosidase